MWKNNDVIIIASGSYSYLSSQLKSPANLKPHMYSVSSKKSSEVVWPAVQLDVEDIGGVTAALSANVTALVAGGEQIQRLGWGETGIEKGAEAELMKNDCDDIYLI